MEINTVLGIAAMANNEADTNTAALSSLAGDGRTTETVMANAAALATIANYASGKPLGSVTITNTKWTGEQITADATANTITIIGSGLANGDRVVFVPLIGDYSVVPTAIRPGYAYYVVGVVEDAFQVSLTSGGAAVDFTSAGTSASYQIEKVTINSIDITGLTTDSCRLILSGGISGVSVIDLRLRVNGITSAIYMPNNTSESILTNTIQLFYLSTVTATHVLDCLSCFVRNNRLYMTTENGLASSSDNSTPTTITRVPQRVTSCFTMPNASFSSINSFNLLVGNGFFLDGFKVEVFT